MDINISAIYHEAKSKYAYAYDNETIHIRIRTAKNDVDKIRIIYGDPFNWGPNKNNEWVWLNEDNETLYMNKEYSTVLHDYYFVALKPKYRRVKYIFVLEKQQQTLLFGCKTIEINNLAKEKDLFNYFNFPFINPIDVFKGPKWVKDTIWYQIFPERFCNGNQKNDPEGVLPWGSEPKVTNSMFFGGDLEGVIQKLDYIKNLGANGIYFTPIFKSPSTHKYDTENYFEIDPQFGNLKTMKQLVFEAHKRGIKVMLDAVFNHCGWNHKFWQDVLKKGEKSKYFSYFHIKKLPVFNGKPEDFRFISGVNELNFDTFAFTPFMPKWNTENEKVRKYLLKVAKFWIRECDIDGFRLDVSNEVDHAFWREFRKTCDNEKKDFFIVGENWDESNPWLNASQFHSVMNYEFMFACWNFFGKGISNALQFKEDINRVLTMYPKNVSQFLFNLLDSHDTTRLLTICGKNSKKAKLTYVFQMTYSGTPSIYYGGEIGLDGEHDPDNRKCMIWDIEKQNKKMFRHLQKLITIRKKYCALKDSDIQWIETNEQKNYLVYKKQTDNQTIICYINNSDKLLVIDAMPLLQNKTVFDIYNEQTIKISSKIYLNNYDFLLLLI